MYNVIDIQTGKTIKSYEATEVKLARRFANRKDLQYGAVRYIVKFVPV